MSSTGDAADLFGTSDGSNDPFGSAVDSVADTPDDLFGAQSASDASDPFAQHAAEQDDWLAQDSGGYAAANNYQNQQPHTVSQAPASPYQAAQQSYASQPRNGYNAGSSELVIESLFALSHSCQTRTPREHTPNRSSSSSSTTHTRRR
jgi:hypothetical protein